MDEKIKINSYLVLNAERERDLIQQVNELIAQRKLGTFITNLLKFALENPKLVDDYGISKEKVNTAQYRKVFFSGIESKLDSINDTLRKIERLTEKNYILALSGKRLGLDEKSETSLRALFLVEKQVEELRNALNIVDKSKLSNKYTEDKLNGIREHAEEILEYIIESYGDLVSEIKVVQQEAVRINQNNDESVVVRNNDNISEANTKVSALKVEEQQEEKALSEQEIGDLLEFFDM